MGMDVLFTMSDELAKASAALVKAASNDAARPILGAIHIGWDEDEHGMGTVELTTTNSYILAQRTIIVGEFNFLPASGSIIVNAKDFCSALKENAAHVKNYPASDMRKVIVAIEDDECHVTNAAGGIIRTLDFVDGEYPNYEKLMPTPVEELTEGDILDQKINGERARTVFTFPNLNPGYILDVIQASDQPRARLNSGAPVRLRPSSTKDLTPWYLIRESTELGKFIGLIMPVRLNP